jgi:SAM-dependent methyltransferase
MEVEDLRQYAPATERNREPILQVLLKFLPPNGNILEIGSGTGEHAIFFAPRLVPRQWIPSEPNPRSLASIQAWRNLYPADNLHPPLKIDVETVDWSILKAKSIAAIVNINTIHIAPWSTCLSLMAAAELLLSNNGILYLYGPFKENGQHTAPSNLEFDRYLQAQNAQWGVRDLLEVTKAANERGFSLLDIVKMPANNLSVIYVKRDKIDN